MGAVDIFIGTEFGRLLGGLGSSDLEKRSKSVLEEVKSSLCLLFSLFRRSSCCH